MKHWKRRRRVGGFAPAPLTPAQVQVLRERQDRSGTRIVRLVVAVAVAVGVAHVAFFSSLGIEEYRIITLVSIIDTVLMVIAFFIVLDGHELPGAILAIVVSCLHLLWVCSQVSADASAESILFPIALAPFVIIRREIPALRIALSAFAIGIYFTCELLFPRGTGAHLLQADQVQTFSMSNRIFAGTLLWVMVVILQRNLSATRHILAGAARYGELRATTDELTGLYNRRPVLDQLRQWAARGRGNYAIALIDLDHFKNINDDFGHECGDQVIQEVALTLRSHFRETDLVSRWGGDEFLVLMPGVRHADLVPMLERLRRAINLIEKRCDGHAHRVTVSIGAAMGATGQTPDQCIAVADQALYRAKAQGRNTVVAVGGSEPTQALGRPSPDDALPTPSDQHAARADRDGH